MEMENIIRSTLNKRKDLDTNIECVGKHVTQWNCKICHCCRKKLQDG